MNLHAIVNSSSHTEICCSCTGPPVTRHMQIFRYTDYSCYETINSKLQTNLGNMLHAVTTYFTLTYKIACYTISLCIMWMY